MAGWVKYATLTGREVIPRTPWNGPDPSSADFRENAEIRLRSFYVDDGKSIAPKPEQVGHCPEAIQYIRDDGTEPEGFCYTLWDMEHDNRAKHRA